MKIFFSRRARSDWLKLDRGVQEQLRKKLDYFVSQKDPLHWAERLKGSYSEKFRFRIGDHRIIFHVQADNIVVLKVGDRKDIYK